MILLHTVIPHRHHVDMTFDEDVKAHEIASDFIDFFRLGFHQSFNKELEHSIFIISVFPKKIYAADQLSQAGTIRIICQPLVKLVRSYFTNPSITLFKTFLSISNALRAPPGSDYYA